MVYLLMIYSDESWAEQGFAESARVMDGHKALEDNLRRQGKFRGGGGLGLSNSAATVRFRAGQPMVVTDGPFAETKEYFGGYYLVEAEDLAEALTYAQRIPGLANRAIEVRPVMHYSPE